MTLKRDFIRRNVFDIKRSSCIFPLDIKNGSDFSIIFNNYWKRKNPNASIKLLLKIFNNKGKQCYNLNKKILDDHYDI